MLLTPLLSASLLLITHGSGEYVNLDDSVKLTASQSCPDGQTQTLIHMLKTDASSRAVAKLCSGMWEPEEEYKDRIEHNSSSSVILKRVNFNDEGLYEFTCGTRVITRVQVTVLIPFDISVSEGDTVKLPCHSRTAGQTVGRVRWERDGELVLELDLSSGRSRYGTTFEGRVVSVSPDYSKGDMSLTVKTAQVEDQGQFICYIDGDRTRGKPDGVRMKVNRRVTCQVTCASAIIKATVFSVAVCLCVVVVVVVWCLKSRGSNVTSGFSSENVEMISHPGADGTTNNLQ